MYFIFTASYPRLFAIQISRPLGDIGGCSQQKVTPSFSTGMVFYAVKSILLRFSPVIKETGKKGWCSFCCGHCHFWGSESPGEHPWTQSPNNHCNLSLQSSPGLNTVCILFLLPPMTLSCNTDCPGLMRTFLGLGVPRRNFRD